MEPIYNNNDIRKFVLQEEPWSVSQISPLEQKKKRFSIDKTDKGKKKKKTKRDSPWIPKHLQDVDEEG